MNWQSWREWRWLDQSKTWGLILRAWMSSRFQWMYFKKGYIHVLVSTSRDNHRHIEDICTSTWDGWGGRKHHSGAHAYCTLMTDWRLSTAAFTSPTNVCVNLHWEIQPSFTRSAYIVLDSVVQAWPQSKCQAEPAIGSWAIDTLNCPWSSERVMGCEASESVMQASAGRNNSWMGLVQSLAC